jgi:hypothetical protein
MSTVESPTLVRGKKYLRALGRFSQRLALVLASLWMFGAIHFNGPFSGSANTVLGLLWLAASFLAATRGRAMRWKWLRWSGVWLIAWIPWLLIRPSNDRNWDADYARTPSAVVEGDLVTFTNFRNFDYTLGGKMTERWETRQVHLSNLRGVDLFLNYWGSELIAHPIFSFDFGDEGHIAFSIETRRERGETYTALGGLYKLYELTYLVGDERDFIRVRTNVRPGEDAYLFRMGVKPETARERFMEYVEALNKLHDRPQFYNVLTANCTTAIRSHSAAKNTFPFDWRLIINGKLDELLAERGLFAAKDLPLAELKKRGHVDDRSLPVHDDPAFSAKIREGVPGF